MNTSTLSCRRILTLFAGWNSLAAPPWGSLVSSLFSIQENPSTKISIRGKTPSWGIRSLPRYVEFRSRGLFRFRVVRLEAFSAGFSSGKSVIPLSVVVETPCFVRDSVHRSWNRPFFAYTISMCWTEESVNRLLSWIRVYERSVDFSSSVTYKTRNK